MAKRTVIKYSVIALILLLFGSLSYFQVWYQSVQRSQRYFHDAMQKYENHDYASALKGEQVEIDGKPGFSGGFQQVMEVWQNPYAVPKPKTYHEAKQMIDRIIDTDITTSEGESIFRTYFQRNNRFLGRILIRVGDLYAAKKQWNKAGEAYNVVRQAFPLDEQLKKRSESKIAQLQKQKQE